MELGFETIGNATLIAHDNNPVLVTDPWITGGAYFGSWGLSHEIPPEQLEAIKNVKYVWLSHGHPDHLSSDSLAQLKNKKILLPDHVGARIFRELREQGFDVRVMKDRTWFQLSPRVRALCIADFNQDAVLLVEIGGRLVVNLNDAGDRGWGRYVRNVMKLYQETYLLALSGYGDADMINFFTEDGERIPPHAALKVPPGQTIARFCDFYGAKYFIPFSSMHKYRRTDSFWADQYTTGLDDYAKGFNSKTCQLLPAFLRVDFANGRFEQINPKENSAAPRPPEDFGDNWSDPLEHAEVEAVRRYFLSFEKLCESTDFINFRVGGKDNRIELRTRGLNKGVTFEVPRNSLLTATRYEIFDDLLIGNFMKTTLHGDWGPMRLYPDFAPFVAKFGDNGGARTAEQLDAYFRAYRMRDPFGTLRSDFDAHCVRPLQEAASSLLRNTIGADSAVFNAAKESYWSIKRRLL